MNDSIDGSVPAASRFPGRLYRNGVVHGFWCAFTSGVFRISMLNPERILALLLWLSGGMLLILLWRQPVEGVSVILAAFTLFYVFGAIALWILYRNRSTGAHRAPEDPAPDSPGEAPAQHRFLSLLSHEIRTPMTAIASSAQVLKQGRSKLSDERRSVHFKNIEAAIRRIEELVENATAITQSEQSKLPFHPKPIDFLTLCESTVEQLQSQEEGPRILLRFDSRLDRQLNLDENLLRHILLNLLGNAVKYSDSGSQVIFSASKVGDSLGLEVADRGMGIPKDDHARIFEPFYRASNARRIHGSGLGLNIVKRAVEAHGGSLCFESEEGAGSTFTIRLPLP